jgi:hypothetical protein
MTFVTEVTEVKSGTEKTALTRCASSTGERSRRRTS